MFVKKIKKRAQEVHIEDIFLDRMIKEKEAKEDVEKRKLETPLRKINFVFLLFLGIVVIGTLLSYSFSLQVLKNEKYEVLAQENKYIIFNFTSQRGIIYDRNMKPLVDNEASFDLYQAEKLVKEDLTHQELILFETSSDKQEDLAVKKRTNRHYQEGTALAHILGYTGKISAQELAQKDDYQISDYTGKEGIERSYEEVLKEKKGELQIERTAQNKEISREIISYPESGDSLILNLDLDLQQKSVEFLQGVIKEVESEKGVVVAMDPRSGEVLALISLPDFDNNLFAKGISQEDLDEINNDERMPQLNRGVGGLYPTGSTIKPIIALAALEEGIITENKQLYAPLELCIPHQYSEEATCFADNAFHGWTDIRRAIAESINPFFYMLGGGYEAPSRDSEFFDDKLPRDFEGLGANRLVKYLELFGFGTSTDIDLAGELAGRVPSPEWKEAYFGNPQTQKWYLGDSYNLSIGQGYLLATPLQLASAFVAIANKGTLFVPQVLRAILPADSSGEQRMEPEIVRQNFISENSLKIVREGMRQAVTSGAGSAHSLNYLPVKVAAKTGTAQMYPAREIYNNWIVAFAPYDEPEIVIVVLIEEVEGMRIAAQKVARQILEWYFSR